MVGLDVNSPANSHRLPEWLGTGRWFERFGAGENPGPARKP